MTPKAVPGVEVSQPAVKTQAHGRLHMILGSGPGVAVYPFCSFPTHQGRTDARPWPHLPAGEAGKWGLAMDPCVGQ